MRFQHPHFYASTLSILPLHLPVLSPTTIAISLIRKTRERRWRWSIHALCCNRRNPETSSGCDTCGTTWQWLYPPPPVPKNHLAQEPTPGSAVKFSHHFFYQGSGFFMFLVDVGQLFRCAGHHFMCVTLGPPIRGDPISHSQAHVCFCTTSSIPCSVP